MKSKTLKDYYKVLMVDKTASQEQIRKSYVRMARLFHPDRNPNNPGMVLRFNEVTEAYKILGDLDNRLNYTIILNKNKRLSKELDRFEKQKLKDEDDE